MLEEIIDNLGQAMRIIEIGAEHYPNRKQI